MDEREHESVDFTNKQKKREQRNRKNTKRGESELENHASDVNYRLKHNVGIRAL